MNEKIRLKLKANFVFHMTDFYSLENCIKFKTEIHRPIFSSSHLTDEFYSDVKCNQCTAKDKGYNKTQCGNNNKICSSCELKKKKQDEINKKELEAKRVKIKENTVYYIANYLCPNRNWNNNTTAKQRIDLIRNSDVNWAEISKHIKSMDYQDFLTTPYWKAIAAHTRYKAGFRCQLCNNNNNLSTHHRDYSIHGQEHACMHELIVLCNHCHQKFHGFEKKVEQPKPYKKANKARVVIIGLIILLVVYLAFLEV